MNKYLLHHFGLGDFLSCKGLVKYLIQNNQNPKTIFYLFVPSRHFKNISFLYRTEKIELIKTACSNEIKNIKIDDTQEGTGLHVIESKNGIEIQTTTLEKIIHDYITIFIFI